MRAYICIYCEYIDNFPCYVTRNRNIERNKQKVIQLDVTSFRVVPDNRSQEMIAMIKKFVLFLLRIFRRALCCFSRKRCDSNSQHDSCLEAVSVVNDSSNYKRSSTVTFLLFFIYDWKLWKIFFKMERDWNSWDDKPRTIEEHIEVYRENLVKSKEPEPVAEVENIDLFAICVSKMCLTNSHDSDWHVDSVSGYGAEDCETEESLPQSRS